MPYIIHVHRQKIAKNTKNGTNDPVIIVRKGKQRQYTNDVEMIGKTRMVYSPHKPLDCGARLWIETEDVLVDGKKFSPTNKKDSK